jgi:hypothetical protein
MIDWDSMMELCGREAPDSRCGEISLDGFRFCVLDAGHDSPHAYETYFQKQNKPEDKDGLVLHCASCHNPLIRKVSSTSTGY